MSQNQILSGLEIDLFTHISVAKIDNIVKEFRMHRCALDFDGLFLSILVKIEKLNYYTIYNSPTSKNPMVNFYSKNANK